MALTFNPLDAARKLRDNGMEEGLAVATVEVVEEATSPLVTQQYFDSTLDRRFAEHRAELFRALWIQGAGIVTINAAIIAAAVTLVDAFGG